MAFKRILCAVDFSEASVRAFQTAVEMARQFRTELHVMHVVEADPVVSRVLPVKGPAEVMLTIEETAMAAIEKLIKSEERELEGVTITTEVDNGHAPIEIIKRSREWRAELIVVGAKGTATLDDVIVGSTAERVVREAYCSVLIVR